MEKLLPVLIFLLTKFITLTPQVEPERTWFEQKAKDAAESRFQAGIHFRTDNVVGLDLGKKVAGVIIQRLKADGADHGSK